MRCILEFTQYSYPVNKNVIVKNIVFLNEQSKIRNYIDILYENDITRASYDILFISVKL